ncbi:MAG: hypothetical protein K2O91_17865 [Lachnospiraceae bacterium]|nr:hypothetical protein [Lachnospiraceae bacterium]
MKKAFLIISVFIAVVVFASVIIILKENYIFEHDNVDRIDPFVDNEVETLQISKDSIDNQERITVESEYVEDDLVYREYTWGHYLDAGYEILIEQDKIIHEADNVKNIVIILDDNVYKEFSYDDNDIKFMLEKSGNYAFLAVDLDGNSVDIASMVMVNKSANGGAILLN